MKKVYLFVILLIVSIFVYGCTDTGNENNGIVTDANNLAENNEDQPEEETTADIMTMISQQDLDGYEIKFLTDVVWDWDFGALYMIDVDEQVGEPVHDAIYMRNSIVEQRLNVNITEIARLENDAHNIILKSIRAGEDEYDVVVSQSWSVGPLATDGNFYDLYDITELQIDQPWWDQNSIRDFSIQDHIYFMTGDYNLINNDATWMLYFNKSLMTNLGLEMPYDLVSDGKWTYDKMMEYQKAASADLDGDGEWTAADRWGQVTHTQHYSGILIAGGESLITRNSQDIPVYGQVSERFYSVYDKIIEMMQTPGYTMNIYLNIKGLPSDKHATYNFLNDEALFCPEILAHTRRFRQMESDFGVMPHPKYDELQENYNSYVLGQVLVTCIPVTNTDVANTAMVLDSLGMLSGQTIIPAYYEVSYIGKFFRDDESIEMINVIRNSRVYDIASAFGWANITSTYENAAVKATPLASVIEANAPKVTAAIQKTLDGFEITY